MALKKSTFSVTRHTTRSFCAQKVRFRAFALMQAGRLRSRNGAARGTKDLATAAFGESTRVHLGFL